MKEELRAMEAHLKELKALKRYKEAETLKEEVTQLKARLSELKTEIGRLKQELSLNTIVKQESCQLRETLGQTQHELSMLKEVRAIINGEHLTVKEAAREFIKAREAEIEARVEKEFKALREKLEADAPELIHHRLLAILKEPQWPAEIAQILEKKAEEKARSKLDEEFQQRVHEESLGRLEEVKQTEWRPFVEDEISRIARDIRTLVAELQGTWWFSCDRCNRRLALEISPPEIGVLLGGGVVEVVCTVCTDPAAFPFILSTIPHKVSSLTLGELIQAYIGEAP